MWVIRDSQMEALAADSRRRFEEALCDELRRRFAAGVRLMGESALQATVRLGIGRAREHGLETEGELLLWTSLALTFGSGFDRDPQYPWVGPLLRDRRQPDGFERIAAVYAAAMAHLDRVDGEQNEEHGQVLLRLRAARLPREAARLEGDATGGAIAVLRELHPRKCAELGDELLSTVVSGAFAAAARHGIDEPRYQLVHAVLVLMLGSDFDRDPQFPWAQAALDPARAPRGADRGERLYHAASDYLFHALHPAEAES